jgi:hypothetical protein
MKKMQKTGKKKRRNAEECRKMQKMIWVLEKLLVYPDSGKENR